MNYRKNHFVLLLSVLVLMLQACEKPESQSEPETVSEKPKVFFDDFSYQNFEAFASNGWKARDYTGHPGVKGARWSAEGVSFHADIPGSENGIVRLTSFTDGTGENTQHTQICHARKYREGTYAARVFFRDEPTIGPDGDGIIETFYAISPLKAPMDLDYSETDFEYLANGGWGVEETALWSTSWETFQLEPWTKVNEYDTLVGSFAGWHTLVLQIADNKIRYFVDGKLFSEHSEKVYPEVRMSINFNLWFTAEGLIDSTEKRQYDEDIDWVFHQVGEVLSTEEVEQRVAAYRADNKRYFDHVPEGTPPLESPCGL